MTAVVTTALFLLAASTCTFAQTSRTQTWHVKDAVVRYRIEKDPDYARLPDVPVLELSFAKGSSSRSKFKYSKRKRAYHQRLDAKLYYDVLGVTSDATAVFDIEKRFGRFVAWVGMDDRADLDASALVEVQINDRTVYKSPKLTTGAGPFAINVPIRIGSKTLKMVTKDIKPRSRRMVDWVNAGFVNKGSVTKASYVRIPAAGLNPADLDVVVVTQSARTIDSRIAWARPHEPLHVFFDTYRRGNVYYVYLVERASAGNDTPSWRRGAGLTLETRYTSKAKSDDVKLKDVRELWGAAVPVGWSVADCIAHAFPVHRPPAFDKSIPSGGRTRALHRYTGYFQIPEAAEYTFATCSNWGSWLLIDDKLVVEWPGTHSSSRGRRGEKQQKTTLQPGLHKIEYLNFTQPGKMFTTAAWQRPDGKMQAMTRSDFVPCERWRVTEIAAPPLQDSVVAFQWRIDDDVRLEDENLAFVAMHFEATPVHGGRELSYTWDFGDGGTAAGKQVEHVFVGPGLRTVRLVVRRGLTTIASVEEEVYAHVVYDKLQLNLNDVERFETAILGRELDKCPVEELVCMFRFGDKGNRAGLKRRAGLALAVRADRAVGDEKHQAVYLEVAQYLSSQPVRRYQLALDVLGSLAGRADRGGVIYFDAQVGRARLLNDCFGDSDAAMGVLGRLERVKVADAVRAGRLARVKVEVLVGQGKVEEAERVLRRISGGEKAAGRAVVHAGLLRHARQLAGNVGDEVQLGYALEKVEQVMREDASKVLDPQLNLVLLDIYVAGGEYEKAVNLARRLGKMELSEYHRPGVMLREVRGLCRLGEVESAKKVYRRMAEDYGNSVVLEEARRVVVAAVVGGRQ